ncbi:MAG: MFS transporter [Anaerolineaceae bacterium]|nr:MFS transporter [Anaerolineaceae bacterium]
MKKSFITIPPALHHRRYALLWGGLLISVTGSQMQLWALFWHIRTLSNQPIAVSGIGLVRVLPVVIFSLLAGVAADRYNRRNLIFFTQTTMMLSALALGLLTLWGHIQIWHIYLLTGIQAIAVAFDGPARQSLVPNLITRPEDLSSAFSMNGIAQDLGAVIGPGLSGLVISYFGQYEVYILNATSFLAVLLALFLMGPVPQQVRSETQPARSSMLGSIKEGVQYILSKPIILSSMVLDFWATFFSAANTLLPFVARDILHVGAIQYGWLSASQSIGGVAADFILSQRVKIRRQGTLLLTAVAFFGAATVLFGISRVFWLTMLALAGVGAADAVSTILRNTIRQLQTPDYIRGRMTGVNQIFFMGGPQLGEIESGLVAQGFGIPIAIISGGIACVVAMGLIALRWPVLGKYNGDEPILAGANSAASASIK